MEGYPYVSFEHAQGVAADFSEEYPEMSLRRPDRWIHVNNRATMMNVLAGTDAYTTGSGLLVENFISQAVVTVPLVGPEAPVSPIGLSSSSGCWKTLSWTPFSSRPVCTDP